MLHDVDLISRIPTRRAKKLAKPHTHQSQRMRKERRRREKLRARKFCADSLSLCFPCDRSSVIPDALTNFRSYADSSSSSKKEFAVAAAVTAGFCPPQLSFLLNVWVGFIDPGITWRPRDGRSKRPLFFCFLSREQEKKKEEDIFFRFCFNLGRWLQILTKLAIREPRLRNLSEWKKSFVG